MKKLLISTIFLFIASLGYSQYIHDLFPCRDSTGARVEGCFAWSDSTGQYIQVTDTFYCDGDNLKVEYRAVNNAWGYDVGEVVYLDSILGVCAGGAGGSTDDQLLSTNGTAGNISIESGNTITLNVDDNDSDPTNEIQDISGIAANTQAIIDTASQIRADFPIDTDTNDIDSTRLENDSILVYYFNGSEIGRDTISGTGGGAATDDQTISIDSTGRVFTITLEDGGSVTFEDSTIPDTQVDTTSLSNRIDVNSQAIIDTASQIRSDFPVDTDTQLSDAEVVQIVRDTGFIEVESDPIWIADSSSYATKVYADAAEQAAKDYADANDDVDDADNDPTNEIQDISGIATNTQAIQDTASQIRADIPTNNNQLINGAGYITSETDDQTLAIDSTGRVFSLTILDGNTVQFEDTNTQLNESEVEAFIDGNESAFSGWDKNVSNDFTGNWNDLNSVPAGFADDVDNVNDADADPANEIQSISIDSTGRVFTITLSSGGTVTFEDTNTQDGTGTDDQTLSLISNSLSIEDGNSVDLSPYLDDTTIPDDQTLSIDSTGRVFTVTIADGNSVNFEDTNTQLNESQVEAFIDGNEPSFDGWDKNESDDFSGAWGDLTGVPAGFSDGIDNVNDTDASTTNEIQTLSIDSTGRVFTITLTDGGSVVFEDTDTTIPDTDDQTLSFTSPNLSISDGNSVDLSPLQDGTGTDDQTAAEVSFSNTTSGLTATDVQAAIDEVEARVDANDAKVTNTDDQTLSLATNTLSIESGNSVDLSGYLDNTDAQDLTLTGNTLAISNDPNTDVDLSSYLDNTDAQTLSFTSPNLSISNGNSVDISAIDTDTNDIDSTRLSQDSILIYYFNGSETGRDTIAGGGGGGGGTQDLQSVTDQGSTTTNSITVGGLDITTVSEDSDNSATGILVHDDITDAVENKTIGENELVYGTVSGGVESSSNGKFDFSQTPVDGQIYAYNAANSQFELTSQGVTAQGAYTPVITAQSNASVASSDVEYKQVGDYVDLFGKVQVTTDSAGLFSFNMTLPVQSFFSADRNASGTGNSDSLSIWVEADPINYRSTMQGRASGAITDEVFFHYSYLVIPTAQKLLEAYPDAHQAWSLRYVSDSVTNVVRVRRDSDNAEKDVTPDFIVDSLESWVGAGNNGFIVTWYDQSGKGNDATSSGTSAQALIVNNGTLVTDPENGLPAAQFDGSSDIYTFTSTDNPYMGDRTVMSVINSDYSGNGQARGIIRELSYTSSSTNSGYYLNTAEKITFFDNASPDFSINASETAYNSNDPVIWSFFHSNATGSTQSYVYKRYLNNDVEVINETGTQFDDTQLQDLFQFGKADNNTDDHFDGYIQELVIWQDYKFADKASIEGLINSYYSVY